MKPQEKTFKLKLSSWQQRIVQDFTEAGTLFDTAIIESGVIQCPASYKIPVEGISRRDWVLYLTDRQMEIVQEEFGLKTPVSGINVTAGLIEKGAIVFEQGVFELKLEPWQQRIVQDFTEVRTLVDTVIIKPGVIQCPASYKIPVEGISRRDWVLYLTDRQMEIVQKEFGLKTPVSGINVTAGLIEKGEVLFQ